MTRPTLLWSVFLGVFARLGTRSPFCPAPQRKSLLGFSRVYSTDFFFTLGSVVVGDAAREKFSDPPASVTGVDCAPELGCGLRGLAPPPILVVGRAPGPPFSLHVFPLSQLQWMASYPLPLQFLLLFLRKKAAFVSQGS